MSANIPVISQPGTSANIPAPNQPGLTAASPPAATTPTVFGMFNSPNNNGLNYSTGGKLMPNMTFGNQAPTAPLTPQTASDLISSITNATQEFGQAQSQSDLSTGDIAEQTAYTNAGATATANARLALLSGNLQQYQEQLQLGKTLGTQQAQISGGNLSSNSGTALALLRSSTQQGLLQQQITGLNAQLLSGGYTQQGEASTAEAAAAGAAGTAASDLSTNLTTLANASKTNAVNEAAALGQNIPGIGNISATAMPTINPVTLLNQSPTMLGGQVVSPGSPYII